MVSSGAQWGPYACPPYEFSTLPDASPPNQPYACPPCEFVVEPSVLRAPQRSRAGSSGHFERPSGAERVCVDRPCGALLIFRYAWISMEMPSSARHPIPLQYGINYARAKRIDFLLGGVGGVGGVQGNHRPKNVFIPIGRKMFIPG